MRTPDAANDLAGDAGSAGVPTTGASGCATVDEPIVALAGNVAAVAAVAPQAHAPKPVPALSQTATPLR
jgi:hypothetical protein